jgi:hypothetical protein
MNATDVDPRTRERLAALDADGKLDRYADALAGLLEAWWDRHVASATARPPDPPPKHADDRSTDWARSGA